MKKIVAAICILVAGGLVAGCQTQGTAASGFLKDYAMLKPHPNVEGARFYQDPSKDLRQYDKFLLDPIAVHFAPKAEGVAIDPGELKELTDYFHQEIVKTLSDRYRFVDAPGPGVMRMRIAITDIKKTVPMLNIHPGTMLTGLGLGGASMEAEGVDSVSGKRILALVETKIGDRSYAAGLTTFGHAKQVMKLWAERWLKRLDEIHGRKAKES